jgi:hypothetical protein
MPPAMDVGIADHVWDLEEFVGLIDYVIKTFITLHYELEKARHHRFQS